MASTLLLVTVVANLSRLMILRILYEAISHSLWNQLKRHRQTTATHACAINQCLFTCEKRYLIYILLENCFTVF